MRYALYPLKDRKMKERIAQVRSEKKKEKRIRRTAKNMERQGNYAAVTKRPPKLLICFL